MFYYDAAIGENRRWPTGRATLLLVLWLAVIARVTLVSAPAEAAAVSQDHWYCLVCGADGVADVLLNLLLFFPLGLALRELGWPALRSVAVMCVITVAIETTQAHWLVGRDGTLGDVMANTTGGWLGWIGVPVLRAMARPSRRTAVIGTGITLAVMLFVWIITAMALRPTFSQSLPWRAEVAPETTGLVRFPGQVLRVSLNRRQIDNGPLTEPPMTTDSISMQLQLAWRGQSGHARTAPVIRLVDARSVTQLRVDQSGDAAIVGVRLRASVLRLHNPKWRFDGALAAPIGTPWTMHWRWHGNRIDTESGTDADPATTTGTRRVSIGLGWALIHPFVDVIGDSAMWWTACWLGWWFGLLGWLAAPLDRGVAWWLGAIAVGSYVAIGAGAGDHLSASEFVIAIIGYAGPLAAGRMRAGSAPAMVAPG